MLDSYQSGVVRAGALFTAVQTGQREDTASIQLRIQVPGNSSYTDYGIWDKRSGGELDSEETTYYPGAMADRISLGGRVVPGNNTLQRLFKGDRDQKQLATLYHCVGKAKVTVTEQPLDIDGNAYGHPIVWSGILKKVASPNRDSESNNAALIEIEISTVGRPTA
jgi:hypothetical protein